MAIAAAIGLIMVSQSVARPSYSGLTNVYHSEYFGFLPKATSLNSSCSLDEMGPVSPSPMDLRSTSVIGATLVAVPVKNASSAT